MSDQTITELKEKALQRADQRAKVREAYKRIYNNPFRTNSAIYDPALFRYEAARAYAREFYKFTPRSLAIPFGIIGLTIFLQSRVNKERREKEAAIRSGETTYSERALWSSRVFY